jgi:hypothetical protein
VTTSEAIEQRLASILGAPLSPELRERIDERVNRAVAIEPAERRVSPMRRMRRAAALAGAAALLVAAGTLASDLFGQLLFQPGWGTAWERSAEIGQEVTVDGQTIRLERGYADSTQVVLGWTGTLPEGIPDGERSSQLSDAEGREYRTSDAAGTDEVPGGVTIGTFQPLDPLPAGDTEFTLWLADDVSFTFTLAVEGGTQTVIGVAANASAFDVTLVEFRAGRSSLLVYLSIEALPEAPQGEAWTPIGHLEFGGRSISLAAIRDGEDGTLIASAVEGFDDPAGDWKLVIDELVGHNGQWPENEQIRISGPWVFEFAVPGG